MKPQNNPTGINPPAREVGNNPDRVVPTIDNIIELKQQHSWSELSKLSGLSISKLRYLYLKAKNNGSKEKLPLNPPGPANPEPKVNKPEKEEVQDFNQIIVDIALEVSKASKNLKGNNRRNFIKKQILEKVAQYKLSEEQFRKVSVQIYQKVNNTKSQNFIHVFGEEGRKALKSLFPSNKEVKQ